MAFSATSLRDDTDFERLVLELLGTHRIAFRGEGAVYDIGASGRGGNISVRLTVSDSLGASAREDLRRSLQPLSFGAAYKTLDLLVEHVLRANGAGAGRLTFAKKRALVANRPAVLPAPFDLSMGMWDALVQLYDLLEESRHAVTHRRARATHDGALEIYDDGGSRIDEVTNAELAAFTGAVHVAAELVIEGSRDSRRMSLAAWYLNALRARHGLRELADAIDPASGIRLARVEVSPVAEGRWQLDLGRVREVIESQPPASV